MRRSRIGIAATIALFAALPLTCILASPRYRAEFSPIQRHLYTRDGYYLVRERPDYIWLTWWFESGVGISPEHSLDWFNPVKFPVLDRDEEMLLMYRLTPVSKTWMLDLAHYGGTSPMTYADLINPKNRGAEKQIRQITRLASKEPKDLDAITRLAGRHFIFLGWTVENDAQAKALRDALAADWNRDRNQPLPTMAGTLYPLSRVLLHKLDASADETTRIESASKAIPLLLENVDSREGHPCDSMHVLFLDGHIENIPFSSRFPATQGFLDALKFAS